MASVFLEPVPAGQVRFRLQGLVADSRGIAIGREAMMSFATLDRVVAFLAAYSDESALDDLFSTLTIERAKREGGGTAFLLRCSSSDAYELDNLARLTSAMRGQLYVGAGATFIRYRDRSAPFGYDLAVQLSELGPSGNENVAVVDIEHSTTYTTSEWLDPVELIQRLSLQPSPVRGSLGKERETHGLRDIALLLVAPGLFDRVVTYLWRQHTKMSGVALDLGGGEKPSLLLRIRNPPGTLLDVLHKLPGVEIFAPVSSRAAVEVGWKHPVNLASAGSCLPGQEMYLFRGSVGRVERLDAAPKFVDGRHFISASIRQTQGDIDDVSSQSIEPIQVELKLRPSQRTRLPRAVFIDRDHLGLLRKMIYLLPPKTLAAASVAALDNGYLVVMGSAGHRGTNFGEGLIPLGTRYCEVGHGVFVPDGYDLFPQVSAEILRGLLGLGSDSLAVFTSPGTPPLRIRKEQLTALDAAALGRIDVEESTDTLEPLAPLRAARLENEKLGRFALWGFRASEK